MRFIILILLLSAMTSCSNTAEDLDNFDMSAFCREYHVIKSPANKIMYILINKRESERRFFIWKNYNYQNTGFGYTYSYTLEDVESIKNGVYASASDAISEAEDNLNPSKRIIFLNNLMPWGKGQWLSNGNILDEICP